MDWPFLGREPVLAHCLGLVESGVGVALVGATGVGKSRVLLELGGLLERSGVGRVNVVATESTRSIPFAPFVELLPGEPTQDPLALLSQALEALQRRRARQGLVIEIDDAHHLDPGSLSLLTKAMTSRLATVTMTARTGEIMPPDVVGLWTNGVMERIEVEPLDRQTTRAVVEGRLGPVSDALETEIWRLSRGNLLVAHELVEGAVGRAIDRNDDGLWVQTDLLAASTRLADLINSRMASLSSKGREAMEVVAIGAPISIVTMREVAGPGFAELQERGLVRTGLDSTGQSVVWPSHPMFGEILIANLPGSRMRTANGALVQTALDGIEADPLRAAVWQFNSGHVASVELAMSGAQEALIRHDPILAEKLVDQIGLESDRAALIMARALSYQRRPNEAEDILGSRSTNDPKLVAEFASARSHNLAFGLGRLDEARDVLNAAMSSVTPAETSRLLNERALISAITGDFVDARNSSEMVLASSDSPGPAVASAFVTLTLAQAMTGDCDALDAIAGTALEAAIAAREPLPMAEHQVKIMQVMSMVAAGRIPEAISLAEESFSEAGPESAVGPTWLNAAWVPLDAAGKHDAAVESGMRALEGYARADPFGLESQMRGMVALSKGQQGDPRAGEQLEDLVLEVQAPRLTVWVERGRAWSFVANSRIDEAVERLVSAGRHALAGEHLVWGAQCVHDTVRLGRPEMALDWLRSLPAMPGAHLVETMVQHGEVLSSGDVTGLEKIGSRFAGMGAALLAAEAWAQAAELHAESDPQRSARCEILSETSLRECEGSDTPALRARPGLISSRESEIALAAATGLTSPEIARREFISVRTVDNHLLSVYRKVGIGGRAELRDLVAPALGGTNDV